MASDFVETLRAMLEVLDPELNQDFTDHFMETGFDLSRVLFIATANTESDIPEALHDRLIVDYLVIIFMKKKIASEYLIPDVCERSGFFRKILNFLKRSFIKSFVNILEKGV